MVKMSHQMPMAERPAAGEQALSTEGDGAVGARERREKGC